MNQSKVRDFLEEISHIQELPILPEVTEQPSRLLLQPIEQQVLELVAQNVQIEDIALRLATPVSVIRSITSKKDFKQELEHLDDLKSLKLKNILDSIIDARLNEFENPAEATKKDLVDVIKVYGDLLTSDRKARKPEEQQSVYINILNQVMDS